MRFSRSLRPKLDELRLALDHHATVCEEGPTTSLYEAESGLQGIRDSIAAEMGVRKLTW